MADISDQTGAVLDDVNFDITQSFYSRTDKRGIIKAGNTTFQSIAGFEWGQLLGAPHRILRNPDTPRAVFSVFWRLLQADEPAVAYVRNQTGQGRGYWVLALAMPMPDGYISVRIKPTSPLFQSIKQVYAKIAAAEKAENLTVEDSVERLMAELQTLGFDSYESFHSTALQLEFRARATAQNAKLKGYFTDIDRIKDGLSAIKKAQDELMLAVESLRDLPTNMRIVASRLEPSGGPLSAMSDIYNATSTVLFQEIFDFVRAENSISKRVDAAFRKYTFLKAAALLTDEIARAATGDDFREYGVDPNVELAALGQINSHYGAQERDSLQAAERLAQDLNRTAYDLRRAMLGLDTIRVMGLVESGRLGAEGSRIGATMEQIGTCHSAIIGLLQGIKDNATVVNAGVAGLRLHAQRRAGAIAAK